MTLLQAEQGLDSGRGLLLCDHPFLLSPPKLVETKNQIPGVALDPIEGLGCRVSLIVIFAVRKYRQFV